MSDGARLAQLFAEAEALPPEGREGFLAGLREEDATAASDLVSLLRAGGESGTVLDGSPWQALGGESVDAEPATPTVLGPYRVVRRIGRGGMGSVYLAEQQGDGFQRQVAIKLVDRPNAGETGARRFRDEARILAGLEHPGIARFYDAGRAADGSLFLVLEYVEGEDLLAHVNRAGLDLRRRVELVVQVVDAVAFAHRRQVVHRDLKPGNVLVDADGRARLLDFGISKILDDEPGDQLTRTEMRAFTPAYASPEQFRGERAGATSDVYSLGVMLYELVAGERPFAARSGTALERAVLDADPDPPSTVARRLATTRDVAPEKRDTIATGVARERVGRDLDAICLMALRRDPAARYASAAALAEDLRRYIDGRPVVARRGGRRYRLAMLLRRRRAWLATAAATLVAVAALVFAVDTRWRASRAVGPPVAPVPRPFPFSSNLLPAIDEAKRRFDAAPTDLVAGAQLALALVQTSREEEAGVVAARLRQIPGKGEDPLIDYVEGTIAFKRDQTQRALIFFSQAAERALRGGRGELLGRIRAARGRTLSLLGRSAEARADMESARADFRRAGDVASLSRVSNDLAVEVLQQGDLASGERLLEEALAATRKAAPKHSGTIMLLNLATVQLARGHADRAEVRMREAEAVARKVSSPGLHAATVAGLAEILDELGRPREAAREFDQSIELLRIPGEQDRLGQAIFKRACFELDRGDLGRWQAAATAIADTAPPSGMTLNLGYAEALRGYAARAADDLPAANARFAEARRLLDEAGQPEAAAWLMLALADVEAEAGGRHVAAAAGRIAQVRKEFAIQHPSALTMRAEAQLAGLAAGAGRLEEAARHLAATARPFEEIPSVPLRIALLRARARLARAASRNDESRRDLAAAIALARTSERKVDELRLRLDLADLELAAGDRTAARAALDGVGVEAARRGLSGIAARARRAAGDSPRAAGDSPASPVRDL